MDSLAFVCTPGLQRAVPLRNAILSGAFLFCYNIYREYIYIYIFPIVLRSCKKSLKEEPSSVRWQKNAKELLASGLKQIPVANRAAPTEAAPAEKQVHWYTTIIL